MPRLLWLCAALVLAGLLPGAARAGCCDVVNTGSDPIETLRVCGMAEVGGCEAVLFEGTLAAGDRVNVCTDFGWIVHDQPDESPDGWGDPTGAECAGADVEL